MLFGGTLAGSLRQGVLFEQLFQGGTLGVLMEAVGLYGLLDNLMAGRRSVPALAVTAKASFCVYLTHPVLLDILLRHGLTAGCFHPAWAAPVEALVLFVWGFGLWLVLRKIPAVNRYLI